MTVNDELDRALRGVVDDLDRLCRTAGVVARLAPDYGIGELIFTGGVAVAIASGQDFATRDLDVVTPFGDRLGLLLLDLGFVADPPGSHTWIHENLQVLVESPASELPPHSAVDEVRLDGGELVQLWSLTDLVIDRLGQATVWGASERLVQALALLSASGERFDLARARVRAHDDGLSRQLEVLVRLAADPPETLGDDPVRAVAERFAELLDGSEPSG